MEDIEIRQLSMSDMAAVEKMLKEEYLAREPAAVHLGVPVEDNWVRIKPLAEVNIFDFLVTGTLYLYSFEHLKENKVGSCVSYLVSNADDSTCRSMRQFT